MAFSRPKLKFNCSVGNLKMYIYTNIFTNVENCSSCKYKELAFASAIKVLALTMSKVVTPNILFGS